MIKRADDPISNTVLFVVSNIDISFRANVAVFSGKCEKIDVKMHDKETGKYVITNYTGDEADLVFKMLAKPAMKLEVPHGI